MFKTTVFTSVISLSNKSVTLLTQHLTYSLHQRFVSSCIFLGWEIIPLGQILCGILLLFSLSSKLCCRRCTSFQVVCVCVRVCERHNVRVTQHTQSDRGEKQNTVTDGEHWGPAKQPPVFLPLFHLRDPHEACWVHASWTPPPPFSCWPTPPAAALETDNKPAGNYISSLKALLETML